MRLIHFFLIVLLVGLSLWIGYWFGVTDTRQDQIDTSSETASTSPAERAEPAPVAESTSTPPTSEPSQPTTISTAELTEGQQRLLRFLGVDETELVITPEMQACAEEAVGAERLTEIINGS